MILKKINDTVEKIWSYKALASMHDFFIYGQKIEQNKKQKTEFWVMQLEQLILEGFTDHSQ
jgi:hypothetical protein